MTALVPSFPPLLKGMAAGPANPFKIACDQARRGVDAGLVAWSAGEDRMRAALVLAPDEPLEAAMAAYIASGVGMQNALGAHAPAETANTPSVSHSCESWSWDSSAEAARRIAAPA